uniref:DUF834 domain-containing protein n=1 Tax=Oryza meridionalis TaxID=40149 RepID=A0A0E0C8Y7_9ORYZ
MAAARTAVGGGSWWRTAMAAARRTARALRWIDGCGNAGQLGESRRAGATKDGEGEWAQGERRRIRMGG